MILSMSTWAWNERYNFEHMTRVDDFDYREVVLENEQWSIVIFNNRRCSSFDSLNDCFPFETKLNHLAPKIYARNNNIQIINMDTESTYTYQDYQLRSYPAVVFLYDGQIMKTIEAKPCHPYRTPQCDYRNMNWANNLLQDVLDEVYKIPQSKR